MPPTDPLLLRAAERTVRLMRDYDASAVEDVFSEGLLNVMDAPEFSRSRDPPPRSSGCSRTGSTWAT